LTWRVQRQHERPVKKRCLTLKKFEDDIIFLILR
jgi:hypothetical protein